MPPSLRGLNKLVSDSSLKPDGEILDGMMKCFGEWKRSRIVCYGKRYMRSREKDMVFMREVKRRAVEEGEARFNSIKPLELFKNKTN